MHNKTTLPNGLRLITKNLPNTEAVTVLVLVGAGSRYETLEINGIAHFIEHMFFKGAKKYKNTKEVSETIDGIGGDFNAFTGKEYAGYYVKVASSHTETAVDVLSDMLINATFDPTEINKERGVILEEYNMYQDTPMYQTGWNFESLIFGDQPIGRDQIGTKELITTVTQDQFRDYQQKLYTPDNTVICMVGNVNHDEALALTEKYFQMADHKKSLEHDEFSGFQTEEKIHLTTKKTEQAHLVLGFPGVSYTSPDRWASKLLSIILGGNMSSRMFLHVREQKGLCYYVRTETDEYTDTGTFTTRAGVDVTRVKDAIESIVHEYKIMFEDGATQAELDKAKSYLKGKMVLRLEDSEEYAHLLGRQELLRDNILDPEAIQNEIDKVDLEDVNRLAKQILDENKLYLCLIGPYKDKEEFSQLLKFN